MSVKAVKKKVTNKVVISSFFKTISIDGRTEQVTVTVRRTLFFDNEERFPFFMIRRIEVAREALDSVPDNYIRYVVFLHLTDGRNIIVDEVGESSVRGGLREMKNLGKKISAITSKELKLCEDS
ncbi:MAG: hypothetical protein ACUBOA_15200 [Candidatus Loosdrechtia sp.]|uniref:hypothetical protein n=1 Tax=Candidatus Loosdrechtia sp. TaxID=3101272 RepID=UPI003A693847|nr:MAG: hypothetical protein QY305_01635 [Candidatus Jettenia sp. AMX2]